jgi:hypothetical protein
MRALSTPARPTPARHARLPLMKISKTIMVVVGNAVPDP